MTDSDEAEKTNADKTAPPQTGRRQLDPAAYFNALLSWYVRLSERLTRDADYTDEAILHNAYKDISEQCASAFEADRVGIWLYNEGRTSMRCVDRYTVADDRHEFDVKATPGLARQHFKYGVPEYVHAVEDVTKEWEQPSPIQSMQADLGIRALLQSHIWRNNEWIGHLAISIDGYTRCWTVEEKVVAEGLANILSRIISSHHGRKTERALEARESELRQVQKMEAIGQLTGGIAHDFNNLIFVVLGNLEAVQDIVPTQSRVATLVSQAIEAADRGATLTERLLAFSRKQTLNPQIIDLNALVNSMDDLLRRTIGEQIQLRVVRSGGLWKCEADKSQLETVILNLAINARDAMASGGKLTIELGNALLDETYAAAHAEVTAGHYAMIAISDTGCGMSPEVKQHIFEPFFTTKEIGQGCTTTITVTGRRQLTWPVE